VGVESEKKDGKGGGGIDRRKFLKYAGATGAAFALSDLVLPKARAVELKRMDITGKVHILGCNEMTSTDGYWDNSTKPVLNIKSGDTVYLETGTHLMGRMDDVVQGSHR
jgi:Ni,Fe-hydrogenase I small subunit